MRQFSSYAVVYSSSVMMPFADVSNAAIATSKETKSNDDAANKQEEESIFFKATNNDAELMLDAAFLEQQGTDRWKCALCNVDGIVNVKRHCQNHSVRAAAVKAVVQNNDPMATTCCLASSSSLGFLSLQYSTRQQHDTVQLVPYIWTCRLVCTAPSESFLPKRRALVLMSRDDVLLPARNKTASSSAAAVFVQRGSNLMQYSTVKDPDTQKLAFGGTRGVIKKEHAFPDHWLPTQHRRHNSSSSPKTMVKISPQIPLSNVFREEKQLQEDATQESTEAQQDAKVEVVVQDASAAGVFMEEKQLLQEDIVQATQEIFIATEAQDDAMVEVVDFATDSSSTLSDTKAGQQVAIAVTPSFITGEPSRTSTETLPVEDVDESKQVCVKPDDSSTATSFEEKESLAVESTTDETNPNDDYAASSGHSPKENVSVDSTNIGSLNAAVVIEKDGTDSETTNFAGAEQEYSTEFAHHVALSEDTSDHSNDSLEVAERKKYRPDADDDTAELQIILDDSGKDFYDAIDAACADLSLDLVDQLFEDAEQGQFDLTVDSSANIMTAPTIIRDADGNEMAETVDETDYSKNVEQTE